MNTLTIALVLAGVIVACSATTCYLCADTDGSCADEYAGSADHEVDCGSGDSEDGGCSKAKSTVTTSGVAVVTIARGCGKHYDNDKCAQKNRDKTSAGDSKTELWECSCDGDKCNGGSQLAFSSALIISALAKYLL